MRGNAKHRPRASSSTSARLDRGSARQRRGSGSHIGLFRERTISTAPPQKPRQAGWPVDRAAIACATQTPEWAWDVSHLQRKARVSFDRDRGDEKSSKAQASTSASVITASSRDHRHARAAEDNPRAHALLPGRAALVMVVVFVSGRRRSGAGRAAGQSRPSSSSACAGRCAGVWRRARCCRRSPPAPRGSWRRRRDAG